MVTVAHTCSALLIAIDNINTVCELAGQCQCCHLFKKIFEKIVADSVIDFLEDNDILYNKQFGFRKRHSTTHAIIALTEKVSMALDSGKIDGGVFLDLKKALTVYLIIYY